MASTSTKRQWWADWRCNPSKFSTVNFPGEGREWTLYVADASKPAWQFFADAMRRHGVTFRESAGGTYNCRHVNHNPNLGWSLHSYGIAIDINPSKNPAGDPDKLRDPEHEFPQAFIDEVLDTGLFRWGWDWDDDGSSDDHSFIDPMHWEIDVPPDQIAAKEATPVSLPITKNSDREEIRHVQEMLGVSASGQWDFTDDLQALAQRSGTGDPEGKAGERVNGRMYTHLLSEFIQKWTAPTGAHDHDGRYVKNVVVSR